MLEEAIKQLEQNIKMFRYAKAQFEGLGEYQNADDMEQSLRENEELLRKLKG